MDRFALSRVWPSVVRDELKLEFALPGRGEVRAELFDLGGRRLMARSLGIHDAGAHRRVLRIADDLPSGMLWLRITQGERSAVARVVLAR